MSIASVNVSSGRARITTPWLGGRIAPGCLETAVDIATFIISWMGPTTKGARRGGDAGSLAHSAVSWSPPHLTQTNGRAQ